MLGFSSYLNQGHAIRDASEPNQSPQIDSEGALLGLHKVPLVRIFSQRNIVCGYWQMMFRYV
jgi:hypothetical protein